jgi:hypothetical protein
MCTGDSRDETEISRSKGRDRMSYMKRYGEERSKMPRVGMGKEMTSLFQTATVLRGKFF